MSDRIDFDALWEHLTDQFLLDHSVHGPAHWRRVERIGASLCERTGADAIVVRLFAVFHDSRRENDFRDPDHGPRAAELAALLRERFLPGLADERFALLQAACRDHTSGRTCEDPTIGTCWDADRLDLGRVGITPDPQLLSTEAARDKPFRRWAERLFLA